MILPPSASARQPIETKSDETTGVGGVGVGGVATSLIAYTEMAS